MPHVIQEITTNDHNVKPRNERQRVSTAPLGKSMTKQADTQKCCIHAILKKYERTGLIRQTVAQPIEGDLPDPGSFHQAMNIIAEGTQAFEILPTDIRQRFQNDPKQYLEFVTNSENLAEMQEMGLAEPPPPGMATTPAEQETTTTEASEVEETPTEET